MTEVEPGAQIADELCEECGYEPELKRTLGTFQVFASGVRGFVRVHLGCGRHFRYL